MSAIQLEAVIQADGSLLVQPGGQVQINVFFSQDELGARVATIAFGGYNQAVVTFDESGQHPMSYSLFDPAPTLGLDQSIQNIVNSFAGTPTLH